MRRFLAAGLAAGFALALAGCGQSTATINISLNGQQFVSMVVTGSQASIDKAKSDATSGTGVSGVSATVVDGDQHQGNKVCETDVTNGSDTGHVVVYSSNPLVTTQFCSQLAASVSSASST